MQRIAGVLLVAAVLAGCSQPANPQPSPESTPSAAPASPASSVPTPVATESATPTPDPPVEVPLALAVQVTRPVADVSRRQASRAVDGHVTRWSQFGQPGGRVRVLHPDPTDSRAIDRALSRVRRDRATLALVPAAAVDATVRVLTVGGVSPLRGPKRYPITTRVPAEQAVDPTVTTVTAVGDIMLGRGVADSFGDDPEMIFEPFADRLSRADITLGNFESTLSTDGAPTQGGDSFAADPDVLPVLESAGFDLLQLANNHVGDYGERALRQTLNRIDDSGLEAVGAGRNRAEARRPVIIERDGIRFGFLACDSIGETPAATKHRPGTNRMDMPPRTGPFDGQDLRRITGDIAALDQRVDVVIMLTHWGTQYTHQPEPSQRRAGRAFADAGADLIIGGHPHWVQGWETRGDSVIVHSLGNFVFDMDFSTQTMQGAFVEAVFWDDRLMALEPVAYQLDSDFVPHPAGDEVAAEIFDDIWSSGRPPYTRTR